ncbi:MAG: PDZ domain-containing protein, partial [Verrucomicrobiota bacterium]
QGQGIGFAIPVKEVSEALGELFTPETSSRWFGAHLTPTRPLLVTAVDKSSPADKAGLLSGDQILSVNGNTPKSFMEFNQWLRETNTENFSLSVQRGQERRAISVQLIPFQNLLRQRLGVDTQEINDELAGNFGLTTGSGLLIAAVQKGGPADEIKLGAGFVITEINGQRVPNVVDLVKAAAKLKKDEPVKLALLIPQRRGNYFIGYREATATLKAR